MTSCDRLIEIVQHLTWGSIEQFEDGHFRMIDPFIEEHEREPIDFYLRVGLHMNRPVQAIIAEGNFLNFRSGKPWENYVLKQINPKDPMGSAYFEYYPNQVGTMALGNVGINIPIGKTVWDPAREYSSHFAQQMVQSNIPMNSLQGLQNQSITTNNTGSYQPTSNTNTLMQGLHNAYANLFGSKIVP